MKSSEADENQSDDAAAETAAAEVAKTEDQSTAQEGEKEVPIDDNQKTQTKEAE